MKPSCSCLEASPVDEFQKRGTPHRHMCVYVEGAPPANVSTADGRRAMIDWFDEIASCDAALLPEHLRKKVQKTFLQRQLLPQQQV